MSVSSITVSVIATFAVAFSAISMPAAENSSESSRNITTPKIAAGSERGVYDKIAASMAQHISKAQDISNAQDINKVSIRLESIQQGGPNIKNLELLKEGTVDLAFVQSDWVYKWYHGRGDANPQLDSVCREGSFPKSRTPASATSFSDVRVVRPMYPAHLQIFARTGIENISELSGRTIAIGAADSASQFHARLVLATAGVTDVECLDRGLALDEDQRSSIFSAKDPEVDALIISGTLRENPGEIFGKNVAHSLPISYQIIERLGRSYPYYIRDQQRLTIPTMLVTRATVDRRAIHQLTEQLTGYDDTSLDQDFYEIAAELDNYRTPVTSEASEAPEASDESETPEERNIQEILTTRAPVTRALTIPIPFHAGSCEAFQRYIFDEPEEFRIAGTGPENFSSYTRIINSFNEQACQELFFNPDSKLARLIIKEDELGKGTTDNLKLLALSSPAEGSSNSKAAEGNSVEFAFAQNDCAYDAYGEPTWWIWAPENKSICEKLGPAKELRAVMPISRLYLQLIARNASEVRQLRQLNSKKMHTGSQNSVTSLHADRIKEDGRLRWTDAGDGWRPKKKIYYQAGMPKNVGIGALWFSEQDEALMRRDSNLNWNLETDSDIKQAVINLSANWQKDQSFNTFAQINEPSEAAAGDIWVTTSNEKEYKKYDGENWQPIADSDKEHWDEVIFGRTNWCSRLRNGEVDGVVLPGSFRTAGYLSSNCSAEHVLMPASLIDRLSAEFPYYHQSLAPEELQNNDSSYQFLTLRLFLLTSEHVSSTRVETLLEALWESWPSLQERNEHLFAPEEAVKATPVPYHDAATEFLETKKLIAPTGGYLVTAIILGILMAAVFLVTHFESSYNRLGEVDFIARNYGFFQRSLDRVASISTVLTIILGTILGVVLLNALVRQLEVWDAAAQGANNELLGLSDFRAFIWLFGFMASGYEDDIFPNSTLAKFFLSILALIGVVGPITLVYQGINRSRDRRMRAAQGDYEFKHRGHVVIGGWNDKARGLIYSLTSDQAPEKLTVIIVTRFADPEPLKRLNFDPKHVFYVRGDSTTRSDLHRANIHRAKAALILDDLNAGSNAAFNSALSAFAARKMNPTAFVAAELSAQTTQESFESADVSTTLDAEVIGNQMLALACRSDYSLEFVLEAMTFDSFSEWYSEEPAKLRSLLPGGYNLHTPRLFADALLQAGMNMIGIHHHASQRGSLNPTTAQGESLDFLMDEETLDELLSEDCHIIFASIRSNRKKAFRSRFEKLERQVSGTISLEPAAARKILIVGPDDRPEDLRNWVTKIDSTDEIHTLALQVDADTGIIETGEELEQAMEQAWDRIVVLSATSDLYTLDSAAANHIDGQTILLANTISRAQPEAVLIADLQRLENRPMLKDAGVKVIVSVPLIMERLMGMVLFGYHSAAHMLLALCSEIRDTAIEEITVTEQMQLAGQKFNRLLATRFENARVIGWLPSDPAQRQQLANTEGDFDIHFIACPQQDDPEVQIGDRLILLARHGRE